MSGPNCSVPKTPSSSEKAWKVGLAGGGKWELEGWEEAGGFFVRSPHSRYTACDRVAGPDLLRGACDVQKAYSSYVAARREDLDQAADNLSIRDAVCLCHSRYLLFRVVRCAACVEVVGVWGRKESGRQWRLGGGTQKSVATRSMKLFRCRFSRLCWISTVLGLASPTRKGKKKSKEEAYP